MGLFSFCVCFIIISISWPGECSRILAVYPFNAASHFAMFGRLSKELATRGHQVDVVSHFPLKKPHSNYNDIVDLTGIVPDLQNNMSYEFATNELGDTSLAITLATQLGGDLCDLMDLPRFRELIKNPPKDPPYDLAIIELLHSNLTVTTTPILHFPQWTKIITYVNGMFYEIFGSTCYLALGQHLNVPIVGIITSPVWPWANDIVGNPDNPAYIPHVFSGLSGKLNFWQRIQNTVTMWRARWQFSYYSAYQDDKIKKYIGPHAPSLKDAEKDVALILANSHFSLNGVRPFTTAIVEVGGLHVTKNETSLPNDLKKWLDDSTDGFILITFGSMLKIETFDKETLTAIYSSLKKLAPVRFLIKVANKKELPPGLPSNVLTLSWVPQNAVLQHENIRAFVTHGGLMGTQEAIYHGVPMIGIPIYADQSQNIELYKQKKIAIGLDHRQLTEENLDAAFDTILHDPSYMESAKRLAAEFRDRPMTALDTAIFWIEYVIRHGGSNIRSPALDLAWWQTALIDVYGAMVLAVVLAIYLLKVIICKIKSLVLGSNAKRTLRTKKNE